MATRVKLFPTPDVGMATGGRMMPEGTSDTGRTPDGRKVQVGLTNAVKMMPTPTARDWKDGSSVQNVPENFLLGRWAVNHAPPGTGMKLSAAWVCRLMGYPDDWLNGLSDLSDATPGPATGKPDAPA